MSYQPSKSIILKLWQTFSKRMGGKWLVSKIVCFKAPYFNSIKPRFTIIRAGHVELYFKKRRAVLNHLNTVHAIAMCNAAELAAGTCLDVSLDRRLRWIPVGMDVKYLKKATTDLRAICHVDDYKWSSPQDVIMQVNLIDTEGTEVFLANITMRISSKTKKP